MARLREQLERFNAGLFTRICESDAATLRRVNEQLLADGLTRAACQPGEPAPDFALADQSGRIVSLHHALERGPLVLNFYRGAWSPFCELTLRAWQEQLARLRRAGASVIAIGPDEPEERTRLATRSGIAYPVLSDPELAVADAYRVSYDMPAELQKLYRKFSPELCTHCGPWRLPFPATYLIGRDGLIRHAHLDPRAYLRMEPETALQMLETVPA